MITQAQQILMTVFGYQAFRLDQEAIIQSVLSGRDTLAIMPTGGGKSLCYQIPALIFPGLTVVISPLISLMKDQVQQLQQLNIDALFLNSSLSRDEYESNVNRLYSGRVKMLYLAPETLFIDRIQNLLSQIRVDCITIDEAHCISDWGHDFRPEYRKLLEFKNRFPHAITLALTATATEQVRADIQNQLNISPKQLFVSSFDRSNLFIHVLPKKDPILQVFEVINKFPQQSGIIYCFSKKQVDELTLVLQRNGVSAKPYHAGLNDGDRAMNQELFIKDDVQIIVATVAFGMGINKPNVRFVIHFDLPKNIESYYQEIGRAGRDGLNSECFLLYSHGDTQKIQYFIKQKEEPERSNSSRMLQQLVRFAETDECKRIELLRYFGELRHENCGSCSSCLADAQEKVDLTIGAQKFMSCVKRSGERFGANHIIDILRGSKSHKIEELGHNRLSTYDIGKEYTKSQWQYITRQMIHKKLLIHDMEFGGLHLGSNALPVLTSQEKFWGRLSEPRKSELKSESRPVPKSETSYDEELFQILRTQRKAWADAQNVPPYVVYSDKTLVELSQNYPLSNFELTKIYGIGQAKIDRYGAETVAIIAKYCTEHSIHRSPSAPYETSKQVAIPKVSLLNSKIIQAVELFEKGESFQEIARNLNVQIKTAISYFEEFLNDGGILNRSIPTEMTSLSDERIEEVLAAFRTCGTELLKPVFEICNGAVNYDSLRLIRLISLNEKNRNLFDQTILAQPQDTTL